MLPLASASKHKKLPDGVEDKKTTTIKNLCRPPASQPMNGATAVLAAELAAKLAAELASLEEQPGIIRQDAARRCTDSEI